MAGAEALDINRINENEGKKVNELRSDREMGNIHSGNVLSLEAGRIRKDVLERMDKDNKSVISDKEKKDWQNKIDQSSQDISRLTSVKNDFEDHWRQSLEMRKRFDTSVHSADDKGMLRIGEHEKLDEAFMKSDLKEKEKSMRELEKELASRRKELNKFLKLEKDVQGKRSESLEGAGNYDEKLSILEESEKENQNYQTYKKIFNKHKDKLSKKTITEYLEWFLTLAGNEQKTAISKAEKEDIQPRVELFEIHSKLPKQYQDTSFKEWGKTQRERYLSSIEQRVDRDHRSIMRKEGKSVFSEKDFKLCEESFAAIKGELGDRLQKKNTFLEALPGQIKVAKKQWTEFEKFDPAIQNMLQKDFNEGNFNERKDILSKKAPKLTEQYTGLLNRLNNKMDAHISESVRGAFEEADTLKGKMDAVKEGEKFQKSKDRYFAKWDKNAKFFRSDREVYEKWYAESVSSLEKAEKYETDLTGMIEVRKKVHKGTEKLPTHIRDRMDSGQSIADRERDLKKLQEIARHYETVIPFLIKNGEKAEKEEDLDTALDFYLQALKLDSDSPELKTMVASLRQRGASHSLKGSSKTDQDQTDKILGQVDDMHDISEEAEELARNQLLLNLARKHREQVGASGSTTDARARASVKHLEKEDHDIATTILDEHSDTHTVDEEGTIRKKMKIKTSGAQEKQTEDQLERFFGERQHKTDVTQKGMAEVSFVNRSGQEMELDTAKKDFKDRTEQLSEKREKNFLTMIKSDGDLSEKQLKAVKEAYTKTHKEDELVTEELERLKTT